MSRALSVLDPHIEESEKPVNLSPEQLAALNKANIDQFRANGGKLGGPFVGADVLLLHTIGAKSGKERISPMQYRDLGGGRLAVFASKAGADTHPAWYHNLVAHPDVTAEVGTETNSYRARTATSTERAPIWEHQKQDYPGFAAYEAATTREIPVVILEPT